MADVLLNGQPLDVAIIGGGPAGLMAAEVLSQAGVAVHVFDAMPSVGRKFLLAGKGGMNLTHSEPFEPFASRYGAQRRHIEPLLEDFGATDVREWAQGLGIDTFVGSSGRVFPTDMKAAPLLRAWLHRLRHPSGESGGKKRWRGGAVPHAAPLAGLDARWRGTAVSGSAGWRSGAGPGHRVGIGGRELGAAGVGWRMGTSAGCARRGRDRLDACQLRV